MPRCPFSYKRRSIALERTFDLPMILIQYCNIESVARMGVSLQGPRQGLPPRGAGSGDSGIIVTTIRT